MCELLGISADHLVSFSCSLDRFASHGSAKGENHDGWGIAAYEEHDARIIKAPGSAAESEWVRFVETHGFTSPLVIAHIRHASAGPPSYSNTHPFYRELGGRMHVFAHNGTLPGVTSLALEAHGYQPIGQTDSEHAFCVLLDRLAGLWQGDRQPSIAERHAVVARFAAEMSSLGQANFLYSDGDLLFAHGHRRPQADGRIEPPGLHFIERKDIPPAEVSWLASGARISHGPEPVAIVASVPLTDEPWQPLREGELLVLSRGRLLDY